MHIARVEATWPLTSHLFSWRQTSEERAISLRAFSLPDYFLFQEHVEDTVHTSRAKDFATEDC